MFLAELFAEAAQPQLVVFYPGRFQPFHLGHRDVFASLQAKFGRDAVYIATSNKVELPKSPFNFSEKTAFMNAAGVSSDRIVQVASPYKLPEQFNPATTIFIVAVGAPDARRLNPDAYKKDGSEGYYKTFKNIKECTTADKHGYVDIADERHKEITLLGQKVDVSHGTPSRRAWNMVRDDAKGREEYLVQMFGRNDPELGRILDKIPTEQVTETIRRVKDGYRLVSHTGKNLGTYPTRAGAERRERQVQYFKHAGESVAEGKITLSTDPNWYGAEVGDYKASGPVVNIPSSQLVGFEPDDKMNQPKSKANVEKIVAGLKQGDKLPPLLVRKYKNGYQVLDGHHRFWAYKLLGVKSIPAQIVPPEDIEEKGQPGITEDAAGVGVVKNSKDPRYVMATAGDQNDVTAATLPKEMQAYGLIGRKNPGAKKQ